MKKGTINIYDYIGRGGIESKDILNILDSFKANDVTELEVRINSSGGSIFEGFSIFNQLRDFGNVTTIVDGIAASIASIIALAGSTIKAYKNSYIFIHNPWTLAIGDTNEVQKVADDLDKFRNTIIDLYKSKTGMGEDELKEFCNISTFLTSEEAKSMGFIDEIIDNYPQTKNYVALYSDMFDGDNPIPTKKNFSENFSSENSSDEKLFSDIKSTLNQVKAYLILLDAENSNKNSENESDNNIDNLISIDTSQFDTLFDHYINSGELLPAIKEKFVSFLNSLNTPNQESSLNDLLSMLPKQNILSADFAAKPEADSIQDDEYNLLNVNEDSLSLHNNVKSLMKELNISYKDALFQLTKNSN